jgi:hypothetical protein
MPEMGIDEGCGMCEVGMDVECKKRPGDFFGKEWDMICACGK